MFDNFWTALPILGNGRRNFLWHVVKGKIDKLSEVQNGNHKHAERYGGGDCPLPMPAQESKHGLYDASK